MKNFREADEFLGMNYDNNIIIIIFIIIIKRLIMISLISLITTRLMKILKK